MRKMLGLCLFASMLLAAPAQAQDEGAGDQEGEAGAAVTNAPEPIAPHDQAVWFNLSPSLAVSGWPIGLRVLATGQFRFPLFRSDSVLFDTTFFGVGAYLFASPIFLDMGAMVTLAPLEIFDVNIIATWAGTVGGNGSSVMGFNQLGGNTDALRNARKAETAPNQRFTVRIEPTLKMKVWRIIALYNWNISWHQLKKPLDGFNWWYEPISDMVLEPTDFAFEQNGLLIFEIMELGKKQPMIWLGAYSRWRFAQKSPDSQIAVGGMLAVRPLDHPLMPRIAGLVAPYVKHSDRVGKVPWMAIQFAWDLNFTVKEDPKSLLMP